MRRAVFAPYFVFRHVEVSVPNVVEVRGDGPAELFQAIIAHKPRTLFSLDCVNTIAFRACLPDDLNLVWFDSHGDFNTEETTETGHLGGMALAKLTGRGDQFLMELAKAKTIPDENVQLVGGTVLDPLEARALLQSGIRHGMSCKQPEGFTWVHLDTDIVADWECAMDHPSAGLPLQEIERQIKGLRFDAISFSLWNPRRDLHHTVGQRFYEFLLGAVMR